MEHLITARDKSDTRAEIRSFSNIFVHCYVVLGGEKNAKHLHWHLQKNESSTKHEYVRKIVTITLKKIRFRTKRL